VPAVDDEPLKPRASRTAAELKAWCEALEAELDATEEGAASSPELTPPPELKERVLLSIKGVRGMDLITSSHPAFAEIPDRGMTTMFWALGVAASFMLAAAFGALWYATRADLGATRANAAQLDGMLYDKSRELKEKERELGWLKDPRTQVALLKGLEANPNAKARLLWHPDSKQGILWVSSLPALPAEKTYELWAFVGDQPVPAGTFDTNADGATVIPISKQESLGEAPVKFAISVEPKGGAPSPTGAILLVGERF
jgi:hypothetical protein